MPEEKEPMDTVAEAVEAVATEEATPLSDSTAETSANEEKKDKTYSQDEVNEIVRKRLERERRKDKEADENVKDTTTEAPKKETSADEELRGLLIENLGLRKGVSEKNLGYLKSLVKDLEGEYSERVDKVLEDFPFLKEEKAQEAPKVLRTSVSNSAKAPSMTREEIRAIKDPKARRKAIKENQKLYQ